jgi:TetR/AcrR family transcriptional regulator, repressor for uid operon
MRKIDEANTETKRKIVLRAALRAFAKIGLQKASMKDICKEAGMRSGHVYYYFPSKEAIVEAVFDLGTEEMIERTEHMLDNDDVIRAIVKMHRDAESERREWNLSPGLRLEFIAEAARNERLCEIQTRRLDSMTTAIRNAARRAVAAGRLDSKFDAMNFARATILIWTGLGCLRVDPKLDIAAYERAVGTLLQPWLLAPVHGKSRKMTA